MFTPNIRGGSIPNFELEPLFPEAVQKQNPVVLVIDSDLNSLEFFRVFLKENNCSMICANSLLEAMEKSKNRKIDLVVSEFLLGQHSCLEIIMLLRKTTPALPVVIMSMHEDLISEKDALNFGADYFLEKPLQADKLHTIIENCTGHHQFAN